MGILFVTFFIFLLLSVPIGVAVILSSLIAILTADVLNISFIARTIITTYDSFPLLAVPLFMLAGEIMGKGGISVKLFNFAHYFLGRYTGGVPMAVVLACLLFGALSGAGAADTAAIGSVMIPAMVRMGYSMVFSATLVAAAGGLAVIMPPSLPMIMYGVSSNASIGALFLGGVIPAFIIASMLCVYCHVYCRIKGYTNEKMNISVEHHSFWEVFRDSFWALLSPVIILGGIYGGIFTPTEASGIIAMYSLFISMCVYKTVKIRELTDILKTSGSMVGPVLIIMGGAVVFTKILLVLRVPQELTEFLLSISRNPIIILIMLNILLLVVGVFMDTLSSILIFTPILLPVVKSIGMDPVHFGVMMVVNLAIGFITPPMAVNLFVVSGITGLSIEKLARGILIPLLVLLLGLMMVTYIPSLTMFLNS